MASPTFTHPNTRQVRRLSLRAKRREDVGRAAISIEDALRTASIPGSDQGSWIVIHKLDLGRIPAGISPTLLSLHIEKVSKSLRSTATPFDSPYANRSNVVVFPSHCEALVQLASRLLNNHPIHEWYWAKLLPPSAPPRSSPRFFAPILSALLREPEAHRAIGRLIPEAIRNSKLKWLGEQLHFAELLSWFRESGIPYPFQSLQASDELENLVSSPARKAIEETLEIWPHDDPRLQFIALASIANIYPRSTSAVSLAQRASQLIRTMGNDRLNRLLNNRLKTSTAPTPTHPPLTSETSISNIAVKPTRDSTEYPEYRSQIPKDENNSTEVQDEERSPTILGKLEKEPSNIAGIVLIIPILIRIGFPRYLKNEPTLLEHGFPTQLLVYFLDRLDCPSDDPIRKILSERCEPFEKLSATTFELWFAAIRSWTKRRLKMPLSELIFRNGMVQSTETHLDIFFDYSKADIRIRREALDVNPGWTPFLGWVISIHYLNIHELNT